MITPTDEATARKAAAVLARSESPLPVYIRVEQKQLQATIEDHSQDFDNVVDDHISAMIERAVDEADGRSALRASA
jgi:transketolase C-terminal domain/subunit